MSRPSARPRECRPVGGRYNERRAKPRRASKRKETSSNGSETAIPKRATEGDPQRVGDPLVGNRDRSQRRQAEDAAIRAPGTEGTHAGEGNPVAAARRGRRRESGPIAGRLSHTGRGMGAVDPSHAQTVDAKESTVHLEKASVAAVRRQG